MQPRGAGTREIWKTQPRFSRKFGNLEIWKFGHLDGRSIYAPVAKMGLSSGFRSKAAASGRARPGDVDDPAEIIPEIWKFGNLDGRSIYTPVAKMGLSSGFRSKAAASGCARPGDVDDPAEILPEIWKFGNLEIWTVALFTLR